MHNKPDDLYVVCAPHRCVVDNLFQYDEFGVCKASSYGCDITVEKCYASEKDAKKHLLVEVKQLITILEKKRAALSHLVVQLEYEVGVRACAGMAGNLTTTQEIEPCTLPIPQKLF